MTDLKQAKNETHYHKNQFVLDEKLSIVVRHDNGLSDIIGEEFSQLGPIRQIKTINKTIQGSTHLNQVTTFITYTKEDDAISAVSRRHGLRLRPDTLVNKVNACVSIISPWVRISHSDCMLVCMLYAAASGSTRH